MARDFAEGLRTLPDSRLVAVTSRTAASLEAFQARYGPERTHTSVEDFLDDNRIDVVYVATPHHRHAADTLACIQRGRPVVCEKPFTIDADQAREVLAAARAARVFCMEAMWTRWIPTVVRLRSMVASGAIGQVSMVVADFSLSTPFDPRSRLFDPAQGGGALLDRGVYGVSFASMLLGPPTRVTSSAVVGVTGVDEHVTVTMEYPDALAVVTASLRGNGANEATVVGSEGTLRVHAPFYRPERLSVMKSAGPGAASAGRDIRSRLRAAARSNTEVRRLHAYIAPLLEARSAVVDSILGNGFSYEAAEAQRCLQSGILESPDMPLDESISVMEVLDQCRSAWSGT